MTYFYKNILSIYQDNVNGKMVSEIKWLDGNTQAIPRVLSGVMGTQTFSIKAKGDGMIEQKNIDKNVVSRILNIFLDSERIITYEFPNENTLIMKDP